MKVKYFMHFGDKMQMVTKTLIYNLIQLYGILESKILIYPLSEVVHIYQKYELSSNQVVI